MNLTLSKKIHFKVNLWKHQFDIYRYESFFRIRNSLLCPSDSNVSKKDKTNYAIIDRNTNLTWYSCGPTVYEKAHLGHARTYVCTDIIRRILVYHFQCNVKFALGITDIDDKIINKAVELNLKGMDDVIGMVRGLENGFIADMDRLRVMRPNAILRVTEHIDEIIQYINQIMSLGYAYETEDGIYFEVNKANAYGKLGNVPPSDLTYAMYESASSTRVKRNPRDFALWKKTSSSVSGLADLVSWPSPWGKGRPGWHIECSAMTHSYFGEHFSIHSGGVDLKFPHHTNEIAQCEAHNCHSLQKEWVDIWIHTGHLYIDGKKMSKSLKNFISIEDYFNMDLSTSPSDDFRLFCLMNHYASSIYYSTDRIYESQTYRNKIYNFYDFIEKLRDLQGKKDKTYTKPVTESLTLEEFYERMKKDVDVALRDDFDTPKALSCVLELISEGNKYAHKSLSDSSHYPIEILVTIQTYVKHLFHTFGLEFLEIKKETFASLSNKTDDEPIANKLRIDSLLTIRRNIKSRTISGLKLVQSVKSDPLQSSESDRDKALQTAFRNILQELDLFRNEISSMYGIQIEDVNELITKWTKK